MRPLKINLSDRSLEPHAFLVTEWRGTPLNAAPEEDDALECFSLSDLPELALAQPSYAAWYAHCFSDDLGLIPPSQSVAPYADLRASRKRALSAASSGGAR